MEVTEASPTTPFWYSCRTYSTILLVSVAMRYEAERSRSILMLGAGSSGSSKGGRKLHQR